MTGNSEGQGAAYLVLRPRQTVHRTIVAASIAACLYAQPPRPDWCNSLPRSEYQRLQRITIADPWFEVYSVAPAVFAIYEPRQAEQTISYLIVGRDRAMLFDTGLGIGNIRKVTARLTKLPIVVLNSHTHYDHVGGNWQFQTVYGMDTVFTRGNAQGERPEAQAEIAPNQLCGDLPTGFDRNAHETRPWQLHKYVHSGDSIDLGGRTLQVMATPGHTPDSICLLDRSHRLLFTGDTFYPGTIWLYRPETDLKAYAASVQALADLAPQLQTVLGAHNIPIAPPSVLPQLANAFELLSNGKAASLSESSGKVRYKANGVLFLLRSSGISGQ